jgi:mxaD protein
MHAVSSLRACAALIVLAVSASSHAAGALSVSREVVVDRSPDTVWKLVGEFNALDVWLPPVQASSTSGGPVRPGSVRILDLGKHASVTEKLTAFDQHRRSYSYTFLASPLPVANYNATIALEERPGGKTLVRWTSQFDSHGASDAVAMEAIGGIYDAGLAKLTEIFKK